MIDTLNTHYQKGLELGQPHVVSMKKMAGVLPSNVSYFMQRLQGVSVSHFKVHPQTDGNQTSGKIVRFELPSNTLLNLRGTRLFFNAVTAGAG